MDEALFEYDSVSICNNGQGLKILDQTKLPNEEVFIILQNEDDFTDAITSLKVRGAPAIGIAAAYGISILMYNSGIKSIKDYRSEFTKIKKLLLNTRPTAVNLLNALNRMEYRFFQILKDKDVTIEEINQKLQEEAELIKCEDIDSNIKIADNAITLLKPSMSILTHCNAGHLAVSRFGTALAPIYLAKSKGWNIKVYSCETRPLLQGARLTSFELMRAGIDVTLLCDNMVSSLMSEGKIDAVITGCDRIARNGDTANKIGTSSIAVLASYYKIPFYVAGPSTTIDNDSLTGDSFVIEQRSPEEITEMWYSVRMAPKNIKVYNPAFDVTKSQLISAIITEKGVFKYPYNF
ncbi:MAG: S-methyl-5-thioribose-1-phosphate isomerase [Bacteroidetes bacterium GWE2_39_28]|nr:MAG: S-methyl-5-thioribose-1-phosphate isomerase [Bacteroidetes bacterium GWE2_39_28]OFY14100.1 MAG: S-methyl-5-thioribose-1-phosphate isomerase [Bacteroidetes bacterium GWF2_39_10]OFZ10885.1 MAG: S-methyl-5-thioribose-1-phosphate isomerase [Bacteroidetes bacterium RIFOXYC2_FULL_39_11]HCT94042.1 S-methyl-5-thioribose-1-phosphate isomerase [Rikenellaceae bacterium]HCV15034.1 S-methyl-5-thioribose-1-phosphate isomerase [Rikenellaceae bacterium]